MAGLPPAVASALVVRDRRFRRLLHASVIGLLGSSATAVVLPLIALNSLAASNAAVAGVTVMAVLPWLVLGLPAGALVDRLSRKVVYMVSGVLRGLVLVVVPVAWAGGWLSVAVLLVVAFASGAASVFYVIADQAWLPEIVAADDLAEANTVLIGGITVFDVVGRSGAGVLLAVLAAPVVVALQSLTAIWSALAVATIRTERRRGGRSGRLVDEVGEGLRFCLGSRPLRTVLLSSGSFNVAAGMTTALVVVFLGRTLALSEQWVGLLTSTLALGAILGSLTCGPLQRRWGSGRLWRAGLTITPVAALAAAMSPPGVGAVLFGVGWTLVGAAVTWCNIVVTVFEQTYAPPEMLARVTSAAKVLSWGMTPVGAGLAALMVSVGTPRTAMVVAALLTLVPMLIARCGSLRSVSSFEALARAAQASRAAG